jgi:RND family efflux transporter MFP subunit
MIRTAVFIGFLASFVLPVAAQAQGGMPAPQVVAAAPLAKRITQWDEYTGRFEAVRQVEVRARVSGFVEQIHFRDGQMVKAGDLLFTIDQKPFQLAHEAAQAEVARATAQVAVAQNDFDRAEPLVRNNTITARDLDQRRANLQVARAALDAAQAAERTAQLNLDWCAVRASIDGRISDRRVDAGNLINGGAGGAGAATLLTTIVSVSPIHFAFDASEADYLRYTRLLQSGQRPSGRDNPNPVQVRLADEPNWSRSGTMDFVDNVLNPRSGTIRGRALFENPDGTLTPGTFGRMRLFGGEIDALLVPDASLVSDQARKILLVVGPDNKLLPKIVELGPMVEGLRVIRSGLAPNDQVVIDGLANPMVRPGTVVAPRPGEIRPAS